MWEQRISHSGLQTFRVVKGQTQYDVDMKAASQMAIWEERWQRRLNVQRAQEAKQKTFEQRTLSTFQTAAAKAFALERTRELEAERESLETLLHVALTRDPKPSWALKKDRSSFAIPKPTKQPSIQTPPKPLSTDRDFIMMVLEPQLSFFDKVFRSRAHKKLENYREQKEQAEQLMQTRFQTATSEWQEESERIKHLNGMATASYEEHLDRWQNEHNAFSARREAQHRQIDELRNAYLSGEREAVEAYIDDVLSHSEYPDTFPRDHQFRYVVTTRTLVLDFELPSQATLPDLKEVKYIATRSELQEVSVSEAWIKKTFDEMLYQIVLRTLYELFESDEADVLTAIILNGWVRSIDRSTGAQVHACVMSLEARKDEFLAINLRNVDPKACFKKLKGVAASKLIELSPVKPLFMLNKEDERFVEGYAVVDKIDERTNLAAMDWLDFENLIRELFEREFRKSGGEVKITQASRDGGVDAVAFDPDPIRGGKIVIQAKRYTNTVGVSAVRDLYGTVHNEGANKGLLVTTSDFGPDAYTFAKDKPLTLLSGGELLYMLSQHGHSAKIDLAEAKKMALENAK